MIIGKAYKIRRKIRIHKNKFKWVTHYKIVMSKEFRDYIEFRKLFSGL